MRLIIATALLLLIPPTTPSGSTVPAFPLAGFNRSATASACHLDLSSEMFGGVEEACGRGANLDRSRCCPVLAAWLFAAHARSALQSPPPPESAAGESLPMMPETESQQCADALQSSLAARDIRFPRPNATCDVVLCFCGIRLHEMGSLICPAAFNFSGGGAGNGRIIKPAAGVRALERNCRNASYSGCTRCLGSLEKLKGGGGGGGGGERVEKMMDRDCRLMGLTWLLARNKSAYIPTVSAVLRAILYGAHPPAPPYRCSLDRENMPLAADSVQFERAAVDSGQNGFVSRFTPGILVYFLLFFGVAVHVGL